VKINDSMFPVIHYSILLTTDVFKETHTVSVSGSPAISLLLD
jgi:hypothetical protein